jgi:hypothetical protein
MLPWNLFFCLFEIVLIWCCIRNQGKLTLGLFLAGGFLLLLTFSPNIYDILPFDEKDIVNIYIQIIVGRLGLMMTIAGFVGLMVKKKSHPWVIGAFAVFMAIFLFGWVDLSSQVAHLSLSKNRSCKVEFCQWYSGRCVLSYYENGVCVGTAEMDMGAFTHPWMAFPGQDGKSVIFFSELDTTSAVFTVDFTKWNPQGVAIPDRLQDVVNRSDFEVRACTKKEVNYVADYIAMAKLTTLSDLRGGGPTWGAASARGNSPHLMPEREFLLNYLKYATSDGRLYGADSQILPEN